MPRSTIEEKKQFFSILDTEFRNFPLDEPIAIYEPLYDYPYVELLVSSPYPVENIKLFFLNHPEWKKTFYRFTYDRKKSNSLLCRMGRMMKLLQNNHGLL